MTAVSSVVRNFVRDMLLNSTYGFNAQFPVTCATYGVVPFALATNSNPPSLLLGRWDLATLGKVFGSEIFPCCVLSVYHSNAMGRQAMRVTPSTFSGEVIVSVDFYVGYLEQNRPADGDALWFAIEDAMVNSFGAVTSFQAIPAGVSYNNEIKGQPGNLESVQTAVIQQISYGLAFNRIG